MIIDNDYSTGDILPASWVVDVANEVNAHSDEIANNGTNLGKYLPLAGGTLDPGAQIKTYGTNSTAPAYSFAANPGCGMYLAHGDGAGIIGVSGELWVSERLRAPSLLVDGKITNAEVNGNTDELALRGIIGNKRGVREDRKYGGQAIAVASRALTLRSGRRFRISGTVNVQKGTTADGYAPGFLTMSLRIDNNSMSTQSVWLNNGDTQSVQIEWTGHALPGASGGTWLGLSLNVDCSGVWGYVGSYQREASLIIEDVGPWKDLSEYGRTTTELENPTTLDLDEGDYEVIELPAPYEAA